MEASITVHTEKRSSGGRVEVVSLLRSSQP